MQRAISDNSVFPSLPSIIFTQIAQKTLACHTPPDLSQAVVLPNYHVAKPLAQALGQIAGGVLLLPQMLTLLDWSQSVKN